MRRATRISTAGLLAVLALALALAGCGVRGTLAPNRTPETVLWVNGPVDTVAHTIRAYWTGQDPDGKITGFEFRWIYQEGAAPEGYDPNHWSFTDRNDSLFTVFAPDGLDFPTLEVRAVDDYPDGIREGDGIDHGTADASPAIEAFSFSNAAPSVRLTSTPPDSTLPVAVIDWSGSDPDGPIGKASYRIWLDGGEDRDTIVSGGQFTLPPALFKDAGGQFEERRRTVYVQAIDVGGRASLPDSFSWFVRRPVGTTLLVDEVANTLAGAANYDNFYRSELSARLGAANYSVLDLELGAYLRTADSIRETFQLFQNVFWYADVNPSLSPVLQRADQPIRDYLSGGGNLYLNSSRVVGTGGALGYDFARDVLGAAEVRHHLPSVADTSTTTNFTIGGGQFLIGGPAPCPFDSLQAKGIFSGVEAFVLTDPGEAAYVAPPGTLDTLHVDDWPVGVSRHYGTGRLVYLGFPLWGMNSKWNDVSNRAYAELRKVFDLFGM
jgi:hypothetical protein